MKRKLCILIASIILSNWAYAQKSDLVRLIESVRENTVSRLNEEGHKFDTTAQVPLVFFDNGLVKNLDSLNQYTLADVKSIVIYPGNKVRFSDVFDTSLNPDAALSTVYGNIVNYGIITINKKEEP